MRRHVLAAVTLALAEDQRADEARDAGVDMDHGAAGEVQHAETAEESAAPDPVRDRRIDQ
jgi:hypothetical protein